MKISQSALKSFYDDRYCQLKWEKHFVDGYRSRPTAAMIDGLVFEEMTIGSTRDNESYIGLIPRLKNGNISKREADIIALSEFAKKTMRDLEIKVLEVQPEWETDSLIGHPDALITYKGNLAIMDLKYTATKEDDSCRWNPHAWGDLKYKDFRQALHYVEMYYQLHEVYLPFFYLVFGKSGWVKFISVDITKDSLDDYRLLLKTFENDLQNFAPKPIKNYSICRKCSINCTKRTEKPNIINIEI